MRMCINTTHHCTFAFASFSSSQLHWSRINFCEFFRECTLQTHQSQFIEINILLQFNENLYTTTSIVDKTFRNIIGLLIKTSQKISVLLV